VYAAVAKSAAPPEEAPGEEKERNHLQRAEHGWNRRGDPPDLFRRRVSPEGDARARRR
jgi:hypothetical protein